MVRVARQGKAEITSHPDQNGGFATGSGGHRREIGFVSSVRSSYSDDGLVYPRQQQQQLFQIFTQSIDSMDVTSVTLGHLNSINAIYVIRC